MKSFLIGLLLGVLFVAAARSGSPETARLVIGLFLAVTGGVYASALLAQNLPGRYAALELLMAALVFELSIAGMERSALWLAAGYAVHGVWDLFHHPRAVPTRVAPWFPPMCAAFDFVVAELLIVGPWKLI